MITTFKHKYNIGDEIFHITPESNKGIIIDINYSIRFNKAKYQITFGRFDNDYAQYYEDEITDTKTF